MRNASHGCFVAVISHARAANVQRMQTLLGPCVTWFVGAKEGRAYKDAGASNVRESGALCRSRNAALEEAWKRKVPCLQLSDDLTKVQRAVHDGKKLRAEPMDLLDAILQVRTAMKEVGAALGGVAPTANPFYANVTKPVRTGFIVGDFICIEKCDIFFDESMLLKEDYDYTLRHISKFGRVARRDDILLTFAHRTNPGGAVAVRTDALEQQMIAHLKTKWPDYVRDNPRRPNEILLKIPKDIASWYRKHEARV